MYGHADDDLVCGISTPSISGDKAGVGGDDDVGIKCGD